MKKKGIILIAVILMITFFLFAATPTVRIKDIATIAGVRANQLVGFGLVVGLKNTGDSNQSIFTQKALTNMLVNMGASKEDSLFKSRNVAAVMVTAELPPFVKPGQKIDTIVSSIGDATSLKGGTLVMTPLKGADDQVYAVCQGAVVVSEGANPLTTKDKSETVGRVVAGAIIEQEVKTELVNKNKLLIVLNKADFTTATRLAYALERGGYAGVKPQDASTVEVPLTIEDKENIVNVISKLEDFLVVPDNIAKVVINQRTGTIVIGEDVKLAPVAISHGEIEIRINEKDKSEEKVLEEELFVSEELTEGSVTAPAANEIKLVQLEAGASLSSLVKALNSVGTSPKDLVAILQALKASGALMAELEVI